MLTFTGPGGTFWCSLQSWQRVAKLAADRGWAPTGIPRPPAPPISPAASGDAAADEAPQDEWLAYLPGDFPPGDPPQTEDPWYANGVVIPDEDAFALADALETALPDIPRFDALSEKTLSTIDLPAAIPFKVLRPGSQVSNYEFFSGPNRQALERFIALCRAGTVTVS